MANGVMNGVMKRRLLFVLGPVTGLVMFASVLMIATFLTNREYKEPYRAPSAIVDKTPRVEGLATERAAAEASAKATPYAEARRVELPKPMTAARTATRRIQLIDGT